MSYGTLARFMARRWPCRNLADWVYRVTQEVLLERRAIAEGPDTHPAIFFTGPGVLADGSLYEAPTAEDLRQLRDILDGKSPSDLRRVR